MEKHPLAFREYYPLMLPNSVSFLKYADGTVLADADTNASLA